MGAVEEQDSRRSGDHAAGTAVAFVAPLAGVVAGKAMDLGFWALLALVLGVSAVSAVIYVIVQVTRREAEPDAGGV